MLNRLGLVGLVLVLSASLTQAENWPRFRGTDGTGVSDQKGIPTTWTANDYEWNIELPGVGHAQPIVWEKKLFATSAIDEGAQRYIFCIDTETGKQLWTKTVTLNKSHKHPKSSWASSTPVTDGKLVYFSFADKETYLILAYTLDGEFSWQRDVGEFDSQHGLGVSPILFDGLLIVANDQKGPSSIIALNAENGKTRWSIERKYRKTSYATPRIVKGKNDDAQLIVVSGATGVTSLDPLTGRKNWNAGTFPLRTVASPVYGAGLIIASCGQGGRYGVKQIAVDVRLNADGAPRIRWTRERLIPYVPTPIVFNDMLFEWNDEGTVACVDIKTGKELKRARIGGNYSGSPICIDGKLYGVAEDGIVRVVSATPKLNDLGSVDLGDPSHSTPIVAHGRLFLRSYHRLAALRGK
ncbi:MAG: hypothetical protein CMJ78_01695 [Planctomycetaceae bacterium]|nr:hypothetical protein [Planctomycetaceae bacterium]